jgi:hypothetical protein
VTTRSALASTITRRSRHCLLQGRQPWPQALGRRRRHCRRCWRSQRHHCRCPCPWRRSGWSALRFPTVDNNNPTLRRGTAESRRGMRNSIPTPPRSPGSRPRCRRAPTNRSWNRCRQTAGRPTSSPRERSTPRAIPLRRPHGRGERLSRDDPDASAYRESKRSCPGRVARCARLRLLRWRSRVRAEAIRPQCLLTPGPSHGGNGIELLPLAVVLTLAPLPRPPQPRAAMRARVQITSAGRIIALNLQSKNLARRNAARSGRGRGPCCASGRRGDHTFSVQPSQHPRSWHPADTAKTAHTPQIEMAQKQQDDPPSSPASGGMAVCSNGPHAE